MLDPRDAQLLAQHIRQTRRDARRHQRAGECAPKRSSRWSGNVLPTLTMIALILGSIVGLFG